MSDLNLNPDSAMSFLSLWRSYLTSLTLNLLFGKMKMINPITTIMRIKSDSGEIYAYHNISKDSINGSNYCYIISIMLPFNQI